MVLFHCHEMMLVAAWMRKVWTIPLYFSHVSWVLTNLMTESSCCFQKEMWEKLRTWILYIELYNFRQMITDLSTPTVSSWWIQLVTMVAWCMWWSDTLWATLTRSQLHSVSCCLSIQIIIVEVCLQLVLCEKKIQCLFVCIAPLEVTSSLHPDQWFSEELVLLLLQ